MTAGAKVVVVDASVLVNLIHVHRLPLLGRLEGYDFVVPDGVIDEVRVPEQQTELREGIAHGFLRIEMISDMKAIALFANLRAIMGKGEAAALALAASKGWIVASDEKRVFRREALKLLGEGRLMTTPGLYVLAIRSGLLAIDEADADKAMLEKHRFRMKFASFRDILEGRKFAK